MTWYSLKTTFLLDNGSTTEAWVDISIFGGNATQFQVSAIEPYDFFPDCIAAGQKSLRPCPPGA